jgi:hypothetical protein
LKKGFKGMNGVNDLRTLKFFVHRLRNAQNLPPFFGPATNEKSVIKSALNDYLTTSHLDSSSREHTSTWLLSEAANNLIPLDQFDWLKENQDACCAVWGHLSNVKNHFLHGQGTGNPLIDSFPNMVLYQQMNIPPKPTSHAERFECIKEYFDTWIQAPYFGIPKSFFMGKLKSEWIAMLKEVKIFSWLISPGRDTCEWAWKYLEDYDRKETGESRVGIKEINFFYPINESEKFLAIYAALRIWDCHKAEKTLLLKNMNKAWRQRQLRREREDKKAINCYVDLKTKERLDKLARYNRCQINEVLTDLINNEYAQLKIKIDDRFNI